MSFAILERKLGRGRQPLDDHFLLIVEIVPALEFHAAAFGASVHNMERGQLARNERKAFKNLTEGGTPSGQPARRRRYPLIKQRVERFLDRFYTYHAQAQKFLKTDLI